jgi:hypothetical protein
MSTGQEAPVGRPKKHPREWTSEEAIHKLFPRKLVKHFKKTLAEEEKSPAKPITKPNSS